MKDYDYRTDITQDALYKQHPEIRAAFTLAKKAYAGIPRGKRCEEGEDPLPYLIHPIHAFDLLIAMGVTKPNMLAAALLHDAIEMYQPYKDEPALMQRELQAELHHEGLAITEIGSAASDIFVSVDQMTNKPVPDESKIAEQMRRAAGMDFDTKLVKIADQTANLYCNLMKANDESFKKLQAINFAQKARDLVKAICDSGETPKEDAELSRWKRLFRSIYEWNDKLLKCRTPKQEEEVRAQFREAMGSIIPEIGERDGTSKNPLAKRTLIFKKSRPESYNNLTNEVNFSGQPEYGGIAELDLDEEGKVISYVTWAAPDNPPQHYRNRMQQALVDFLRNNGHDVVQEQSLEPIEVGSETLLKGRRHRFESPVSATLFADDAYSLRCVSEADSNLIKSVGQNMERDFWFLETGGAARA